MNPPDSRYAVLRNRDFRLFISGLMALSIGMGAQGTAIGWDVYARTGRVDAIGLTAALEALPMLALTLPAGYLADRFDRRIVSSLCLSVAVLCSLGLLAVSWTDGPLGWMFGLLFVDACAMTLARPSRGALLPVIVPREQLARAVTWRTSLMQIAGISGPALGGLLAWLWLPSAYLACAIGAAVAACTLLPIRARQQPMERPERPWKAIVEGLRHLFRTKLLLAASSLDLFAVLLGGATYLLPVFARDILGVGEWGLGVLRAAPAAGAAVMGFTLAHLPPMRHAGRNLILCVVGFGLATIGFGLSTNFWLSAAMLFLTGVFDNVSVVVRGTLLQLLSPDELRGRVTAANWIFVGSSNQIGGVESTLVAAAIGPIGSVVAGGLGSVLVAGVVALWVPSLRRYGALGDLPSKRA